MDFLKENKKYLTIIGVLVLILIVIVAYFNASKEDVQVPPTEEVVEEIIGDAEEGEELIFPEEEETLERTGQFDVWVETDEGYQFDREYTSYIVPFPADAVSAKEMGLDVDDGVVDFSNPKNKSILKVSTPNLEKQAWKDFTLKEKQEYEESSIIAEKRFNIGWDSNKFRYSEDGSQKFSGWRFLKNPEGYYVITTDMFPAPTGFAFEGGIPQEIFENLAGDPNVNFYELEGLSIITIYPLKYPLEDLEGVEDPW